MASEVQAAYPILDRKVREAHRNPFPYVCNVYGYGRYQSFFLRVASDGSDIEWMPWWRNYSALWAAKRYGAPQWWLNDKKFGVPDDVFILDQKTGRIVYKSWE